MPLINRQVMRYLIAQREGADYVVPVLATGPQPMFACYHKTCLSALERMATAKELRLHALFDVPGLHGRVVTESELTPLDPQLLSFLNINTPADLELVRKLVAQRTSDPPKMK